MTYLINKTDGTTLTSLPDGQIDQLSTDLTLIGKNYSGFGEYINENFIKILENFASSTQPTYPIKGQLWFDTLELKLKVFNGGSFSPVSSASVAKDQPTSLGAGDFWFNNETNQLYLYTGKTTILLGPAYSSAQGKSGLQVETVIDTTGVSRVISYLYTSGSLIGIFAKEEFIPKNAIPGFSDSSTKIIYPGFNASTLAGIKFNVTSTNAEQLDGTPASSFARKDRANIFDYQLVIKTDDGILVGSSGQGLIDTDVGNLRINNTFSNRNIELNVRTGNQQETAIDIVSATREVKIYKNQPASKVTVGGDLTVDGNLTVLGTTTSIDTSIIAIADKNIELAKADIPTDANANGGGIIIKGATDHKLIWVYDTAITGQANESWNTDESFNIASGKAYKINGVDVLTATACFVPSFPNVNQIGPQITLTVDDVFLDDNRIATLNSRDLELAPLGNIKIIGNKKIAGLTTTNESHPSQVLESSLLSADELSEATTKKYVTNFVRSRSLVFSFDTSDLPSNSVIANYLTQVAPPDEFENGTIARILCSAVTANPSNINLTPYISKTNSTEYVTPTGTNFPLQDLAIGIVTLPSPSMSVSREVKTFKLIAGAWALQT